MHAGAQHAAPPDVIVIEPPDGGMAQLAISPMLSARKSSADDWMSQLVGNQQPPPLISGSYATPPPLRAGPPMLRRQNASRFSWPPDAQQEWTYIAMSPEQIVEQAARLLEITLTVEQVCSFFQRASGDSRAYCAYASRWRVQLEEVLR
jgi:hypothetical protein